MRVYNKFIIKTEYIIKLFYKFMCNLKTFLFLLHVILFKKLQFNISFH